MNMLLKPEEIKSGLKLIIEGYPGCHIIFKTHNAHGDSLDLEIYHKDKVVCTACLPQDGSGDEGEACVIINGINK